MSFRITSSSFAERAIQSSALHRADLARFQMQISSGLRFQRPSEEPIAFRQLTSLNQRFAELSADRKSINHATSILNASAHQIQQYSDVITSAKNIAQRGIQSLDQDERVALAHEVDGLLGRLKSIGLSQFNGKYIFGGARTDEPPFVFTEAADGSQALKVQYAGSDARSQASIGDNLSVDTYYVGEAVFANRGREASILVGKTGARPGQGTDTMIGRASLIVSHETTTYLGTSGVQAGLDSAGGDTVIGPPGTHKLMIVDTSGNGTAGTLQLNGGPPVPFTNSDTNLRVESPSGQVVYVDTTSIAAGFSGEVDIESTGRLSIDDGQSSFAITFDDNQRITHAESGRSVTIDSTRISQTGTDSLEFPGTANAFQVLDELATDLRNSRNLDPKQLAESIDRRLADLERLGENAFEVMGEQGTSLRTLSTVGQRVEDLKLAVETQASELQATDIPETIIKLRSSQSLLQYTYAVTAELTQLGLLQFLR